MLCINVHYTWFHQGHMPRPCQFWAAMMKRGQVPARLQQQLLAPGRSAQANLHLDSLLTYNEISM